MRLLPACAAPTRPRVPLQSGRLRAAPSSHRCHLHNLHSSPLHCPPVTRRAIFVQALSDIEVTHKKLPDSRVELTLTVSPDRSQQIHDDVVKRLQRDMQLPGFRKGQNVPQALLIRACGGEKAFKGEVLKTLIEESIESALEEWQGIAIDNSDRLESDAAELLNAFDSDAPIVFRISFDVMSELTWKSPFQELRIEVQEDGNEETDKRNVEQYVRTALKQKGMQRLVMDRGLEMGDVAIMDFDFVRPDNRESLPHLKQEKYRFDTDLPDSLGVVDKLLGIQVGDVREIDCKFPESWEPAVYRGVEAIAIVKCLELFAWDLPELTDDFVKSLRQKSLLTVEDFRSSLLMGETSRRAERLKNTIQDTLMEELAQIVDMTVSETALMETAKVKYQNMLLNMQSTGKIAPAALESLTTEAMLRNYMMSHKAELENDQKAVAAMSSVFKELGLQVTDDELNAEVAEVEREFKEMEGEYDTERLREMAIDVLQNKKVVEWFIKNNNVSIVPYSKETAVSP